MASRCATENAPTPSDSRVGAGVLDDRPATACASSRLVAVPPRSKTAVFDQVKLRPAVARRRLGAGDDEQSAS